MEKKAGLFFGLTILAIVLFSFIPVNAETITQDLILDSSITSSSYIPVGGELVSGGITILQGILLAALVVVFAAATIVVARKFK
jgi:hypothetical protein